MKTKDIEINTKDIDKDIVIERETKDIDKDMV